MIVRVNVLAAQPLGAAMSRENGLELHGSARSMKGVARGPRGGVKSLYWLSCWGQGEGESAAFNQRRLRQPDTQRLTSVCPGRRLCSICRRSDRVKTGVCMSIDEVVQKTGTGRTARGD